MNIIEIILKKTKGKTLTKEEIAYFVQEYTKGNIADYQAAALIMAIFIKGLSEQETVDFTIEMANSGDVLDLSSIGDNIIDKHSTGGIGDKITLILTPIIASLGIPVAKMSGRGLGYTGGTVDKMEAIPGYTTELTKEKFIKNVKETGIALVGQTSEVAPADKKIYALRDAIGCVENLELIASSIMSKKIALGANGFVLDVTVGHGAFMKTLEQGENLANMLNLIGRKAGKKTACILTNMNEPVGKSIGNILEVEEAIEALKGNLENDVKEIVLELGAHMMFLYGGYNNLEENKQKILEKIQNGDGYKKFIELVQAQGGDAKFITGEKQLPKASYIIPVLSEQKGYVKDLNGETIGKTSVILGAGRVKKEDKIDHTVGIILNKKNGDKVEVNEVLAYIYANEEQLGKKCTEEIKKAYTFTEKPVEKEKTILKVVI